jgi:transposase, IS5 family
MDRCWLQGATGDALHALSCAAGYNIRWLLRAIVRLGLGGIFCAFPAVFACLACLLQAMSARTKVMASACTPHRRPLLVAVK